MSEVDLDEVIKQLAKTHVGLNGVSFESKSLKLDTEEDAKDVVDAINKCENLEYLHLGGNTLGVDAAKAIAKALEAHTEFKRALWMDMFTGRMKTEIPQALKYLGAGLVLAGARLSELDLSDNAFGPIGVEGLAALLRSPTCYALHVLKLNNNGLGITGAKLLSQALLDCYQSSNEAGRPLALKVFVAGRNRLENEGAKALAKVFKMVGTLEEVTIPQNGIYHVGVTALCEAFALNPNLRLLNLNDNTVREKGAIAMAEALPSLQNLIHLNLGDCLLKTKGALLLAEALTDGHSKLQEVHLGFNEITAEGGLALAKAMKNKKDLKQLELGGNMFGKIGRKHLILELKESSRLDALGSLSEDEEDEDNDDEEDNDDAESEEESGSDDVSVEESKHETTQESETSKLQFSLVDDSVTINVQDFMHSPTADNFLKLGANRNQLLIQEVKSYSTESYLEKVVPLLMKISSISTDDSKSTQDTALACSNVLFQELFIWGTQNEKTSEVNNALLVHLGLIKSEDKNLKLTWNLDGCMTALNYAVQQEYFPSDTRQIIQFFLGRPNLKVDGFLTSKRQLMNTLLRI